MAFIWKHKDKFMLDTVKVKFMHPPVLEQIDMKDGIEYLFEYVVQPLQRTVRKK